MKKCIAVVGTILVDKIHTVNAYPNSGELTKIISTDKAVGGCVPNVAVDIKKVSKDIEVVAIGRIGKDDDGAYVKETLKSNGANTESIVVDSDRTSFTEVISVSGGQRTFFTYAGASANFGCSDVDVENLNASHLHLGYFLLLDKIDNGDGEKLLKKAQEKGIKTSIDLVSENSDRYSLVLPALKYTDNLIINEVEAGKLTKIEPTICNLEKICRKLKSYGVKERVIIHTPEVGVILTDNDFTMLPSYDIPKGYIKGTTGAGDAFCSGALVGIYQGLDDKSILELASSVAVTSLASKDATGGILSQEEIKEFCKQIKRKELCL